MSTDGSALPFPTAPSASIAGYTLAESTHQRRVEPRHLPDDAPNIVIVLLDDVGFGLSDVVGGEVRTPAFRRVAENGICYNTFHTTSICSPTRAALLTGRNHHRVHSGTIAERAVDWDGYTGVIGKDTATVAEVLGHYGYCTAAFGKWHNSPATQTTAMGPFDRWPTGHGFDYFYGFIAGETSQWEPRLYQNLNPVEPPEREGYHLSEDLADNAISWLRQHRAYAPDRPFFMYWAPGAAHGPHHVAKEWADKYQGAFDDGWDAYRERVFTRQKATGWIPAEAELTPRADTMQGWADIPEEQRPFQRRLMEVFAGFLEHVDVQIERSSTNWTARASPTTPWSSTSSATTDPAPKASAAASVNCWRRTVFRPPSKINWPPSTPSAGWRPWVRRKPTTCTTPAGHGPATPRSTTPSWWPATSAAPATRWRSPGRAGSPRTVRCAASSTTSTTSPHHLRDPRHHRAGDRRRPRAEAAGRDQPGLHLRPRRRAGPKSVQYFETPPAAASTKTAGTPARSGRSYPGTPPVPPRRMVPIAMDTFESII